MVTKLLTGFAFYAILLPVRSAHRKYYFAPYIVCSGNDPHWICWWFPLLPSASSARILSTTLRVGHIRDEGRTPKEEYWRGKRRRAAARWPFVFVANRCITDMWQSLPCSPSVVHSSDMSYNILLFCSNKTASLNQPVDMYTRRVHTELLFSRTR